LEQLAPEPIPVAAGSSYLAPDCPVPTA